MEVRLPDFKIIGIATKTINSGTQSMEDLGMLWERFYKEGISEQIINKSKPDVFALYTDYESDYRGSYTAIIGHKVDSLDRIPEGLIGRAFSGGNFLKIIAKGKMPDAIVNTWNKIWEDESTLNRSYTVDFEVYGPKSQNGDASEVELFLAVE